MFQLLGDDLEYLVHFNYNDIELSVGRDGIWLDGNEITLRKLIVPYTVEDASYVKIYRPFIGENWSTQVLEYKILDFDLNLIIQLYSVKLGYCATKPVFIRVIDRFGTAYEAYFDVELYDKYPFTVDYVDTELKSATVDNATFSVMAILHHYTTTICRGQHEYAWEYLSDKVFNQGYQTDNAHLPCSSDEMYNYTREWHIDRIRWLIEHPESLEVPIRVEELSLMSLNTSENSVADGNHRFIAKVLLGHSTIQGSYRGTNIGYKILTQTN